MIGFFLDDERSPEDVFWINYDEISTDIQWYTFRRLNDFLFAVSQLDEFDFSNLIISLDHDIADKNLLGQEVTGYDAVKGLCDYMFQKDFKFEPWAVIAHTQNPIGKENILKYWDNFVENCL